MEDTKTAGYKHSIPKTELKATGSSQMAEKVTGQPQKKKIKLDRSSLNSKISEPKSLSNGLKSEIRTHSENIEKKKHDKIKSQLKSPDLQSIKKEIKSPIKTLSVKPPLQDNSDDDDIPLAERAKTKMTVPSSHNHAKAHSPSKNRDGLVKPKSERPKSSDTSRKNDHIKSEKHSQKHSQSSSSVKKIKCEADTSGSLKVKVNGEKKIKSESGSERSPKVKVEGEKQTKSESGLAVSPKAEGVKDKVKTSTDDSDDDVPLVARVNKVKKDSGSAKKSKDRKRKTSDDDEDDYKPEPKAKKKSDGSDKGKKKEKNKDKGKEKDNKKGKEQGKEKKEAKPKKPEEEVWKWWEEEKHPEGIKWLTLEHKGPYFPPAYEPLPDNVKFYYDAKEVKLSLKSEEVAGFYAKMLDHEYTSKKIFNDNFFEDWRKEMTDEERKLIKDLSKCNFKEFHAYYVQKNEDRKNMSKEEKQKLKEKNEEILQEYGYCLMDGHKERVGNFKIEPPGLFRGRGDHPKQGKLKKRVEAKDVTINISKSAVIPTPPEGQKWKAVTHDNKVTWLACWIENIQGSYKYVMLNPTSRIKGEKDWQKYETARKLKGKVDKIRSDYTNDWKSKEMRLRQRGVALYFIDKLALRAGHEKDEDTADTVGCCSLRVEHIKLHRQMGEKEYVVEFDFLGKDSIHYHNLVEVEKRVFKNLELFKQGKTDGDDLFDRLSTASLNKYLSELMEGLSAKVFRTYNASMTLQDQLNKLNVEDNVAAKVLGYNRANRAVAILCNHQRSAPKTFEQSMSNLQQKIEDKKKAIKEAKKEVKDIKAELKSTKTPAMEKKYEKKKTALARLQEQLFKLEVTQTDKEENKEIALGTSKLNYLDPRISIAWCRKNDVPIEKIYNKTQRQKFAWAIDMTEEDFEF